ncbi:hypothetical protein L2E82_33682 [Cichorium intybus]|uniref:Uncharacterized protein n=1 Tax=Cichorium intybus TaxID=13427 RepID=A0ACB9BKU0_CICIN|nr:hypothetical protein L2E82_33682 [Cichorium intybus]
MSIGTFSSHPASSFIHSLADLYLQTTDDEIEGEEEKSAKSGRNFNRQWTGRDCLKEFIDKAMTRLSGKITLLKSDLGSLEKKDGLGSLEKCVGLGIESLCTFNIVLLLNVDEVTQTQTLYKLRMIKDIHGIRYFDVFSLDGSHIDPLDNIIRSLVQLEAQGLIRVPYV